MWFQNVTLILVLILLTYEIDAKKKGKRCPSKIPSPKTCARKPNEHYIDGGSPCQTRCSTLNQECNIQTFAPVKACYCIDGYARNKWGLCVKINSPECQKDCKKAVIPPTPSPESCAKRPNEEYINGGSACQANCNDPWAPCNIRPIAPVKACYCKNGYARDANGYCISINSDLCQNTCWATKGPSPAFCARKPNEVYVDGGSACQTTCATLNDVCNIQTFAPVKACYCVDGYARDLNGQCIQINSDECQAICANRSSTAVTL